MGSTEIITKLKLFCTENSDIKAWNTFYHIYLLDEEYSWSFISQPFHPAVSETPLNEFYFFANRQSETRQKINIKTKKIIR
jgi:hypothetical protein